MKKLRKPMRSLGAGSLVYPNLGDPDPSHKKSDMAVRNAGAIPVLVAPDQQEGQSLSRSPLTASSLGDIGSDVDTTGSGAPVDRDVAPLLYDLSVEDTGEGSADLDMEEPPTLVNARKSSLLAEDDEDEDEDDDLDEDDVLEDEDDDLDDDEDDVVDPADDLDEDEVLDPDDLDEELEDEGAIESRVKAVARRQVRANDEDLDNEMAIVDVDDMDDEVDATSVNLASLGNRLLVLHSDRVVASMDEQQAEKVGVEDEMHSPEFAAVVATACERQGLRQGLSEMGFVLAKVNVGASHVVNRKVTARAEATTRALKASLQERERGFQQCMALAAVGLNKGYWKDIPNTLRPAIESHLLHAGVQNPKAVVARIFAEHGVEFSKAIVKAAQRLADMPEQMRNVLSDALDFTTDIVDDVDEEVEEEEATAVDYADGDEGDFEDVASTSVTAALAQPGRPNKGALLTPKTKVTAAAILAQDHIDFV